MTEEATPAVTDTQIDAIADALKPETHAADFPDTIIEDHSGDTGPVTAALVHPAIDPVASVASAPASVVIPPHLHSIEDMEELARDYLLSATPSEINSLGIQNGQSNLEIARKLQKMRGK